MYFLVYDEKQPFMYVNIPVIYGFDQMKVYGDFFQGSLKGKPHVFAGKIKVDVNVAGDLGGGFSLENSA